MKKVYVVTTEEDRGDVRVVASFGTTEQADAFVESRKRRCTHCGGAGVITPPPYAFVVEEFNRERQKWRNMDQGRSPGLVATCMPGMTHEEEYVSYASPPPPDKYSTDTRVCSNCNGLGKVDGYYHEITETTLE